MNRSNGEKIEALADETLYVESGSRKCTIYAVPYMLRPGLSPEALENQQKLEQWRVVGTLEDGRITALDRRYWSTTDETMLTGGMLLAVKKIPAAIPNRN